MNIDKVLKGLPHKCSKDEDEVCDFCLHFLFYHNKDGFNIDGSGWCGFKRKKTDAGWGCKNYYCKVQWKKNMQKYWSWSVEKRCGLK